MLSDRYVILAISSRTFNIISISNNEMTERESPSCAQFEKFTLYVSLNLIPRIYKFRANFTELITSKRL